MEHHPFLSFDNGLEITYSDIKKKRSGSEYVTIYFEQPDETGRDFKSAPSAISHAEDLPM